MPEKSLRQGKGNVVEADTTLDPLSIEKEKTQELLKKFREIAPQNRDVYGSIEYYTRTLKDRAKNYPYGSRVGSFLRSLDDLFEGDQNPEVRVYLAPERHGTRWLSANWTSEAKLSVRLGWRNDASTQLSAGPFSYIPNLAHLIESDFDKKITPELAGQIYSNGVLELLVEDLEANQVAWEEELQAKREKYFADFVETRGPEDVWVVNRSLKRLAEVASDQEYMVFAPPPKANEENSPSPIVLYTTANLTQELSEKFSQKGGGYYHPTEFRSSNARDAKPVMITPYGRDDKLTVEIRQTESLMRYQKVDLQSSFSGFMYGSDDATDFSIFPPDEHRHNGIDTTLVSLNPTTVKLEKKSQTAATT